MPTSASFKPEMISTHDRLFTTSQWFLQMWPNHSESLLREVPQDQHEKLSKIWRPSSFSRDCVPRVPCRECPLPTSLPWSCTPRSSTVREHWCLVLTPCSIWHRCTMPKLYTSPIARVVKMRLLIMSCVLASSSTPQKGEFANQDAGGCWGPLQSHTHERTHACTRTHTHNIAALSIWANLPCRRIWWSPPHALAKIWGMANWDSKLP